MSSRVQALFVKWLLWAHSKIFPKIWVNAISLLCSLDRYFMQRDISYMFCAMSQSMDVFTSSRLQPVRNWGHMAYFNSEGIFMVFHISHVLNLLNNDIWRLFTQIFGNSYLAQLSEWKQNLFWWTLKSSCCDFLFLYLGLIAIKDSNHLASALVIWVMYFFL